MSRSSHPRRAMVGQATAALAPAPRRWLQRHWGLPHIHARQDWSVLWPLIAALPLTDVRLLDAGCGDGRWTLELAARRPGWQLVGIDRDPAALELAEAGRRRLALDNVSFVQSDFTEFRTPAPFDVVLSVCSAHYLVAAGAGDVLFAWFAAALKPGGQLMLYGPRVAAEAPWTPRLPRPSWHDVFTADQLRRLCAAHGLGVSRLEGHLGAAGTLVKQIDLLATGRWRRLGLAAGLYGLEWALAVADRRRSIEPGAQSLMWLLVSERHAEAG
jgi:SAM-dependent methyltransferase